MFSHISHDAAQMQTRISRLLILQGTVKVTRRRGRQRERGGKTTQRIGNDWNLVKLPKQLKVE